MRLLMTTDAVGGVWTFTQELTAGLLERGCAVALVSLGRAPSATQRRWAKEMEGRWRGCFRFEAVDVPLEWMQDNGLAYAAAECALLALAEELGAEMVHSSQFCFGALPLDVPKLVTAHSDVLSWASGCGKGPLEESDWLRRYCELVQSGLDGADAVVAPTQWMMQALKANFDVPGTCVAIANGRGVRGADGGARKLQAVTAGRLWDEAKGIALLGEVTSPMPLLVAGDWSCDGAECAAALGETKLLGVLAEEDVLALFRESAIYMCTSVYEPFGLAPLEAGLCGCAVVARNLPSLREVWGDGALYFTDAESLSGLLHGLYDDEQMLAEAQRRSLARARCYSRDAMVTAYLAVYEDLLARRRLADVA